MGMVPHERSLVKRLEGKPFALIGVNVDTTKEAQKKCEEEQKITWRSFFDGKSGPISKQWNIRFLPTIYIMDAKGVVRYKGVVRPKDIDDAVDTLFKEMEGKK